MTHFLSSCHFPVIIYKTVDHVVSFQWNAIDKLLVPIHSEMQTAFKGIKRTKARLLPLSEREGASRGAWFELIVDYRNMLLAPWLYESPVRGKSVRSFVDRRIIKGGEESAIKDDEELPCQKSHSSLSDQGFRLDGPTTTFEVPVYS